MTIQIKQIENGFILTKDNREYYFNDFGVMMNDVCELYSQPYLVMEMDVVEQKMEEE